MSKTDRQEEIAEASHYGLIADSCRVVKPWPSVEKKVNSTSLKSPLEFPSAGTEVGRAISDYPRASKLIMD